MRQYGKVSTKSGQLQFGVAGLLLRFMTGSDLLQGVGISLVFIAGVGLLVDGFAEQRTHPYMNVLQGSVAATGTR